MKDNWIKPFQEKLGDYEMDLPMPAAAPRRLRWLVPSIAAAAAAAAALLLLLPGSRSKQSMLDHRIAEARSYVTPSLSVLPTDIRLPRHAQPLPAAAQEAGVRKETAVSEVSAVNEEPAVGEVPAPAKPVPDTPETVQEPGLTFDIEPEPEPVRFASRFSTKLFAGNITADNARQRSIDSDYRQMLQDQATGIGLDKKFEGNNSYEFDNLRHVYNQNARTPEPETVTYLPLKAGISFRYEFAPRFSVESGLTYSYHHSKQSISGQLNGNYYRNFQLHYLGIPLKIDYSFLQKSRVEAYLSMGGEAEMLAFGRITTLDGLMRYTEAVTQHPLQFSLLGAAGAEYRFTPNLGLYVEPGLAWHFKPGGAFPNYYREHPWSFDLRVGLRLRLH